MPLCAFWQTYRVRRVWLSIEYWWHEPSYIYRMHTKKQSKASQPASKPEPVKHSGWVVETHAAIVKTERRQQRRRQQQQHQRTPEQTRIKIYKNSKTYKSKNRYTYVVVVHSDVRTNEIRTTAATTIIIINTETMTDRMTTKTNQRTNINTYIHSYIHLHL